jgi:hypothetical protein
MGSELHWLRTWSRYLPGHRLVVVAPHKGGYLGVVVDPFASELVNRFGIVDRGGWALIGLPDDLRAWEKQARLTYPNLVLVR